MLDGLPLIDAHLHPAHKVGLKLPQDGRRRLQGRIVEVQDTGLITFDLDGSAFAVAFDNIDKARIIPDWAALGLASSKPGKPARNAGGQNKKPSNEPAASEPRPE